MKRLTVLRHAEAVASESEGDHARVLSKRGLAQVAETGSALTQHAIPEFALVSDSVRTRETFKCLVSEIGRAIPHRISPLLYCAAASTILDLVVDAPSDVNSLLIVGHNPGVAELARTLATTGNASDLARLAERFPTSSFAVIGFACSGWAEVTQGGMLEMFRTVDC